MGPPPSRYEVSEVVFGDLMEADARQVDQAAVSSLQRFRMAQRTTLSRWRRQGRRSGGHVT
jgi:hypothetical protein